MNTDLSDIILSISKTHL